MNLMKATSQNLLVKKLFPSASSVTEVFTSPDLCPFPCTLGVGEVVPELFWISDVKLQSATVNIFYWLSSHSSCARHVEQPEQKQMVLRVGPGQGILSGLLGGEWQISYTITPLVDSGGCPCTQWRKWWGGSKGRPHIQPSPCPNPVFWHHCKRCTTDPTTYSRFSARHRSCSTTSSLQVW